MTDQCFFTYTPSHHTAEERLCAPGGRRFAVSDSGPGIALADLPHIFDPLYRGDASRNRGTGGAGLGLAIARCILRAHGGDLSAANRPGGGGAELSAILPAEMCVAMPATPATADTADTADTAASG